MRRDLKRLLCGVLLLTTACAPWRPLAGPRAAGPWPDDPRIAWIETGDLFRVRDAAPRPGASAAEEGFFAGIVDARFGPPGDAARSLQTWLHRHPEAPATLRALGWRILGERRQFDMRYAESAAAVDSAIAVDPGLDAVRVLTDARALARIAADLAPTTVVAGDGTRLPLQADLARLMRIEVATDAGVAPFIVDTGAQISVVAEGVADALGLTSLPGSVRVETPTDPVEGHLVVAPRLHVGDMTFADVLFLCLPDAQLSFAEGRYVIDGILGLPVFATAGRMAWSAGGDSLRLGAAAPRLGPQAAPMFWHVDGLGLGVGDPAAPDPAFFDSGAGRTLFGEPILGTLAADQRDALETVNRNRTTAAGSSEVDYALAPQLTLVVDGHALRFDDALIETESGYGLGADLAKLGSDLIRRSQEVVLDFDAMRYRVTPEPADGTD